MRQRWKLGVMGIGTCLALAVPAGAAAARTDTQGGQLTGSDQETTVLAAGKVATKSGKVASAANVVLYAWPSNDVTDKLQVGDEVNMQAVSETVAAADGSFSLSASSLESLKAFSGSDNILNFDVVAESGDSVAIFSFTRKLIQVDGKQTLAKVADESAVPAPSLSLKLDGEMTDSNAEPTEPVPEDAEVVDEAAPQYKIPGCKSKLQVDWGAKWVLVGQDYNLPPFVVSDFTYTAGASSELGMALSVTGMGGTFTASGSIGKSTTAGLNYPKAGNGQKRLRDSSWRYGLYKLDCINTRGFPYVRYQARVTSFAGGMRSRAVSRVGSMPYCTEMEATGTFRRASSSAEKWGNGAELKTVIGFDLTSQTGFSNDVQVSYTFSRAGHMCGKMDYPGGYPKQMTSNW